MSSYNLYGGTPKKTLDLMKHFKENSILYVYNDTFPELKSKFEETGGRVYEGFYGQNVFLHLKKLLLIIDNENINLVQTQFSMGETLGFLIKLFRPKVKLIIAFVGSLQPSNLKSFLVSQLYRKADFFIYISAFVKAEKIKQFPILKKKNSKIIYNGTEKRIDDGEPILEMKSFNILDIAGLTKIKNIEVLIEALNIIVNELKINDIFLYVAGDGPQKPFLKELINSYKLQNHVFLLGYQTNVGRFIDKCNLFVHPCYVEGFGIAVAEAMHAAKPIIVSNAGALPELIEDGKTGLIVDPFSPVEWAEAILLLKDNKALASKLCLNARKHAQNHFNIDSYCKNYEDLYVKLLKR